ncbi:MAG: hypothetical protein ACLPUO_12460 [Streptosporangiaceae bacterium]|jgi:hypothetical protein
MKLVHLRRHLAAGAIALSAAAMAVAGATAGSAAAAAAHPAAAAAHHRYPRVLVNCRGHGLVRPRMFVLACADADDYLSALHWHGWGAVARGHGREWLDNCVPSCAAGKFHRYPVRVELWRLRRRHPGQRYYRRMTLTYTKRVPRGYHYRRTISLWPSI